MHPTRVRRRMTESGRSYIMRSVRSRNTRPERAVRSLLHSLHYRFGLHAKQLPGTPDVVFANRHKVIWIHGCYWHGHGCKIGRLPKSRLEFWKPKIEGNRLRDQRCQNALSEMGWQFLVIWQCQLSDTVELERRLRVFLGPTRVERAVRTSRDRPS